MKNLVLCLDGTNNKFGTRNTNVVRLLQLLDRDPSKGQIIYYDAGVGTLPEQGLFTTMGRNLSVGIQLAFGRGLTTNVEEAYSFLSEHYEEGDRIYIFGFSRGAYTARVLAALLHQLGLLMPASERMVPHALRVLRSLKPGKFPEYDALCREFRSTFSRTGPSLKDGRCPVAFLGLWDTVSTVGWLWNPTSYPFTRSNPSIRVVRHAVAVDERRTFYRQNLWERAEDAKGQDVREEWFPGVHSDVGGGYEAKESRLWCEPLRWIVDAGRQSGLCFDEAKVAALLRTPADEHWASQIHNSLKSAWLFVELVPKLTYFQRFKRRLPTINLGRRRVLPKGARLHASVELRMSRATCSYEPSNVLVLLRTRAGAAPPEQMGESSNAP